MTTILSLNKNVKKTLFNMCFDYNENELIKSLVFFEKKFDPIINLEKYDKLGIVMLKPIDTNNDYIFFDVENIDFYLYLDKYIFYQSITRWYYNQNRVDIFTKIDILFNEYDKIMKKLILFNSMNENMYIDIINKYFLLNDKLKNKLTILKETYNDDIITGKINKYIQILQYNNKFEKKDNKNCDSID